MKRQIGVLKHPGFNGGGGGGGSYTPAPTAPRFEPTVNPQAPSAPAMPTAPSQFTGYGSLVGYGQQPQYNPYVQQPQYNTYGQAPRQNNPFARANVNALTQASQQYNAYGPQMQQYGRDRVAFGQQYDNYARDVNAYNQQAQSYRDTYGSGYTGYNAPSNITQVTQNSLLGQPDGAAPYTPNIANAYVSQLANTALGGKGAR